MFQCRQLSLFGHLGDQDVWNYHLIRKPEVVYKLPCAWNAQLGGARRGLQEQCMPIKILHANAKSFETTESYAPSRALAPKSRI